MLRARAPTYRPRSLSPQRAYHVAHMRDVEAPVMFLRREEQRLGVVEQLPPLLDRHYGQIGACHGGTPITV